MVPAALGYKVDQTLSFYRTLLDRVQSLPGVIRATLVQRPPLCPTEGGQRFTVRISGHEVPAASIPLWPFGTSSFSEAWIKGDGCRKIREMRAPEGSVRWGAAIAALALCFQARPATAQEPGSREKWIRQEQAAGNWRGIRAKLERKGIKLETVFTGEAFANLAGGIDTGAVFLDNFDLTLTADLDKLLGWRNTTLFLYGLGDQGRNPSELAGDAQGISSIAAYSTWKLYEAWLQHKFQKARLSLLAGFYDLNSEFDSLETANYFLNPSHGIGPEFAKSGKNGPSIFPTTTIGVRVKWFPSPGFYLQSVLLNGLAGDPDDPSGTHLIVGHHNGVLYASEAAYLSRPSSTGRERRRRLGRLSSTRYTSKIAIGGWFYTARFDALYDREPAGNPVQLSSSHGVYAIAERRIWGPAGAPDQGLTVFGRLG